MDLFQQKLFQFRVVNIADLIVVGEISDGGLVFQELKSVDLHVELSGDRSAVMDGDFLHLVLAGFGIAAPAAGFSLPLAHPVLGEGQGCISQPLSTGESHEQAGNRNQNLCRLPCGLQ